MCTPLQHRQQEYPARCRRSCILAPEGRRMSQLGPVQGVHQGARPNECRQGRRPIDGATGTEAKARGSQAREGMRHEASATQRGH
eukprot:6458364-Amphidinium_carterae.1